MDASDLQAMGTDELRKLVRERFPQLTGYYGATINKQECIEVLTGKHTAIQMRAMLAARISGKAAPINPTPAQAKALDEAVAEKFNKAEDERIEKVLAKHAASTEPEPVAEGYKAPPKVPTPDKAALADEVAATLVPPPAANANPMEAYVAGEKKGTAKIAVEKAAEIYEGVIDMLRKQLEQAVDHASRVKIEPAAPRILAAGEDVKLLGQTVKAIAGTEYLPDLDPQYDAGIWQAQTKAGSLKFKQDAKDILTMLLNGKTIWLAGPKGCGKTTVIEWICAMLGWPYIRVQGNKDMSVDDFVGTMQAGEGKTFFVPGPLYTAMKIGAVLLVDECGRFPSDTTNILHGVAENNAKGTLTITIAGGEVLKPHPNFRIVATDNSMGFGDQSGLYPDIRVQDAAFLDRFTHKVNVTYPTPASEAKLLVRKTGIAREFAKIMVKFADETRKAVENEQMMYALSTRALLNWASEALTLGMGKAFCTVILNSVPHSDQAVMVEIAQRHLGDQLKAEVVTDTGGDLSDLDTI